MRFASIGLIIAAMAMSGCAQGTGVPRATSTMAQSSYSSYAHMQQVNYVARMHNVDVIWVHPPQR